MGLAQAKSLFSRDMPMWFDLSLVDVPPEVLTRVLSHVPLQDCIHSCRLVCKQWKDIIDTRAFWKTRCHMKGAYQLF